MVSISCAVALGPAMEIARSPDSRVSAKLITSTVRQTSRASTARRTRNAAWRSLLCRRRSVARLPARRRQFEPVEGECRRDDATAQRPAAQADAQTASHVAAQAAADARPHSTAGPSRHRASRANAQQQRCAGLPDPKFGGIHAVPVAAFAVAQQEQDRGAGAARSIRRRIAPGLAIVPALGMRPSASSAAITASAGAEASRRSINRDPSAPCRRCRGSAQTPRTRRRASDARAATAARRSGNPDSRARRRS